MWADILSAGFVASFQAPSSWTLASSNDLLEKLNRSDIKQREEEARHARLEDRARLVEESRRSYEERVRREEDEIAAREQEVGIPFGDCGCCGSFPSS